MNSLGNRTKVHVGLKLLIAGLIGAVSLQLLPATVASAQTVGPSWSVTGNLNRVRAKHTATLLSNGKVLVVGGEATAGLKVAELYNPTTGMWSSTGTPNGHQESQTATLLRNGKVLVAGGFGCTPTPLVCSQLSSAELYDPETGIWSSTGSLNTARDSHTATLLPNGKVLVAGGIIDSEGTVSKSAELYDPGTETWSMTGHLNTSRVFHTATLLVNGQVLVSGGVSTFNAFLSGGGTPTAEVYDSATGLWNATGSMSSTRAFHTSILLQDGRVLVAGGNFDACFDFDCIAFGNSDTLASAELWDPANGAWVVTGNLDTSRALMSATLLPSGKVLVAGGLHVVDIMGNLSILNSAELYDPASGTWGRTASLNTKRFSHTATLLSTGKVLAAGGIDDHNEHLKSAELFGVGIDPPNLGEDPQIFVRQHYLDFLNREPDPDGLAFWTNEITSCGADAQCIEIKRINVSAAFFLSIEFQNTGYLVERMYKAAYGDATDSSTGLTVPVVRCAELNPDSAMVGQDVVVNSPGWEQKLETKKEAYSLAFVQRQRFLDAYPPELAPAQFVTKLNMNAGNILTQDETNTLVTALSADPSAVGRAKVLMKVAENSLFDSREKNRAFVLMEYFGYLRRDPDSAPDSNYFGYQFWLAKLDQFGGDFNQAEMVKAFIQSTEYRQRFASK